MLKLSAIGLPQLGPITSVTAGTTQTQAGATAITQFANRVTTGVANDGVALPRGDNGNHLNQAVLITNLSAVILRVYPYYTSAATNPSDGEAFGGTVDGGAANVHVNHAASTTRLYTLNSKNTWVSMLIG